MPRNYRQGQLVPCGTDIIGEGVLTSRKVIKNTQFCELSLFHTLDSAKLDCMCQANVPK